MLIFFWSMCSYFYFYKNFFLNIISIEFMVISLGINIFINFSVLNLEYFMIIYFIFSVMESLILLCLLVSFINLNGSDKVEMLNLQF